MIHRNITIKYQNCTFFVPSELNIPTEFVGCLGVRVWRAESLRFMMTINPTTFLLGELDTLELGLWTKVESTVCVSLM